jgi:hypothetical protein
MIPGLIGLIGGEVVGLALVASLIVTGAAGRRPRRLGLDDHVTARALRLAAASAVLPLVLAIDG